MLKQPLEITEDKLEALESLVPGFGFSHGMPTISTDKYLDDEARAKIAEALDGGIEGVHYFIVEGAETPTIDR